MTRVLAGRYQLHEEIGVGGTSRVHRATDLRLGRDVAVKLLDSRLIAESDPMGRDRFLQEGRVAASFLHPHVVTVFDAGEEDGDLYLVMELVEGTTLARHLADQGGEPLPFAETRRLVDEILDALAGSHRHGIVHRDLKPANVLLDPDGWVKLADFGIAKRFGELDASVSTVGLVVGTPRYLAPEQSAGEMVSPATDVYGVGVLLYEMLTGRLPFDGGSPVEVALAHQTRPAPDPETVNPAIPRRVARVVLRALAKCPDDRFADAAAFRDALTEAWLVSDPAPAPVLTHLPPPPPPDAVLDDRTLAIPVQSVA
jgi:eukaryotic-like serine/threonine-protein kinase